MHQNGDASQCFVLFLVLKGRNDLALGVSQMALTLLAERRKPSGECLINAAKPEGSRPAATRSQSKVSANGRQPMVRSISQAIQSYRSKVLG